MYDHLGIKSPYTFDWLCFQGLLAMLCQLQYLTESVIWIRLLSKDCGSFAISYYPITQGLLGRLGYSGSGRAGSGIYVNILCMILLF